MDPGTPRRERVRWSGAVSAGRPVVADLFVGPGLLGLVPLPYGEADLELAPGDSLRFSRGGSVRWAYPTRRVSSLRMALTPRDLEPEPPPQGARLRLLTETGAGTGSVRDWSLRTAPAALPPRELAERLTRALRAGFGYTLANPSGSAANPLEDFLLRTRAGHCEYFASALAFALRYRGVPARVAVGYRLGPWIEEGGYFLVTQAEAHSWVESYDSAAGGWRTADPTPAAAASPFGSESILAALTRWTDTLRFAWDRNVVRFSDDDQLAGAGWAAARFAALGRWRPGRAAKGLAALALLAPWPGSAGACARAGPGRPVPGGSGSCGPSCAGPGPPCRRRRRRPPGPGWSAWPAAARTGPPSWSAWPGRRTRPPTAGGRAGPSGHWPGRRRGGGRPDGSDNPRLYLVLS